MFGKCFASGSSITVLKAYQHKPRSSTVARVFESFTTCVSGWLVVICSLLNEAGVSLMCSFSIPVLAQISFLEQTLPNKKKTTIPTTPVNVKEIFYATRTDCDFRPNADFCVNVFKKSNQNRICVLFSKKVFTFGKNLDLFSKKVFTFGKNLDLIDISIEKKNSEHCSFRIIFITFQ